MVRLLSYSVSERQTFDLFIAGMPINHTMPTLSPITYHLTPIDFGSFTYYVSSRRRGFLNAVAIQFYIYSTL